MKKLKPVMKKLYLIEFYHSDDDCFVAEFPTLRQAIDHINSVDPNRDKYRVYLNIYKCWNVPK